MSIISHPHAHARIVERSLLLEWATQSVVQALRKDPKFALAIEMLKDQIANHVVEAVSDIGTRGLLIEAIRDGVPTEDYAETLEDRNELHTLHFDLLLDILYAGSGSDGNDYDPDPPKPDPDAPLSLDTLGRILAIHTQRCLAMMQRRGQSLPEEFDVDHFIKTLRDGAE